MVRLLLALLGASAVAVGYAAASGLGGSAPARTVSIPGAVPTALTAGSTTAADVSGPCDEPEHRDDVRCARAPAPAPVAGGVVCSDDRSGPNRGSDRAAERGDRSGPGSGDDEHDRSGRGSGDHDNDNDNDD